MNKTTSMTTSMSTSNWRELLASNKNYIFCVLILIIALIIIFRLLRKKAFPYKSSYLLTKCEFNFYRALKPVCDQYGLIICPKVGLRDFITVTCKRDYLKYFRRISQKHVDFLICDDNLRPLIAIELDDSSHELEKARKNDEFKNELYKHINLPLVRVKAARYYKYQDLDSIFAKIK